MLEWIVRLFRKPSLRGFGASRPDESVKHDIFKVLPAHIEPYFPQYETERSAGMDVRADVDGFTIIPAAGWKAIPTGLYLSEWFRNLPENVEIQVRSRSGLALKKGLFVLNSPGTIDQDYPGEICVILANHSDEDVRIQAGDRIAQLVISPVTSPVDARYYKNVTRTGGFGSTGI